MDEDYARLLRDWLLADPGTPRPRSESDDVVIPLPRLSDENRRRNPVEDRTAAEDRGDPGRPRDPECRSEVESGTEAGERGPGKAHDPGNRSEGQGGTEAEHYGPEQPRTPESRSAAEERSRWNHPSNWHRRKAARAEVQDRVAEPEERRRNQPDGRSPLTEPEEPIWPRDDPDQVVGPSRWSRLDERTPWTQLDDAVNRSRRHELDQARERCRRHELDQARERCRRHELDQARERDRNDDPEDRSR
jgi:hypothetical protein